MNGDTISHIMKVIEERGIDAWWTDAEDDPAWVMPGLQGTYMRGRDTMDVWFDSGTSWTLLAEQAEKPVADVYLEGTDQHRGWFQSSLLTHITHQQAAGGAPRAPYKQLITHGFTLDQDGRKMSKSLGNVISPNQITDGSLLPPVKRKKQKGEPKADPNKPAYDAMGPDALRLWVASSDYTKDVVIGQSVLLAVQNSLHKYRVTFKWLLGALSDFNYEKANAHELLFVDHLALYQLQEASNAMSTAYKNYEFFKATSALNKYINIDLSAFYFETLKDRLYTGTPRERGSAQAVIFIIYQELLSMMGPICPLLVEEVWDHALEPLKDPKTLRCGGHPLHVVWRPYQAGEDARLPLPSELSGKVEEAIDLVSAAHSAVKAAQEVARAQKKIGSGLECDVLLCLPKNASALWKAFQETSLKQRMEEELAAIFVVSEVGFGKESDGAMPAADTEWSFLEEFDAGGVKGTAVIVPPKKSKCPRCWRFVAPEPETLCQRCESVVGESATVS